MIQTIAKPSSDLTARDSHARVSTGTSRASSRPDVPELSPEILVMVQRFDRLYRATSLERVFTEAAREIQWHRRELEKVREQKKYLTRKIKCITTKP